MKNQNKFILFGIIAAIFFTFVNLLVYNDVASLWQIEIDLLALLGGSPANITVAPLPFQCLKILYTKPEINTLALRLSSAIPFLWTLAALYYLGRKILGEKAALMGTFITASSFILLFLGKLVVADNWLVLAQTIEILSLLYFIKQPKLPWLVLFILSLVLSATIAPWSTVIFSGVLLLFFGVIHPKGKNLLGIQFIVPTLIVLAMIVLSGSLYWETPGLLISWSTLTIGKYFSIQLLGIFPWLAFLVAAYWDSFKKIIKREELAILYMGTTLAAIVSGSAILQVVFAWMAGRHFLYYFQQNYPYRRMVSGLFVIYIIASFFLLFAMVMTVGYAGFGGTGYRGVIAFALAYWGGSLVAVTGLLANNQRNVIGGLGFATMMGFLMLVINGLPLLESRRGWQKTMVNNAVQYKNPDTKNLFLFSDEMKADTSLVADIYAEGYDIAVKVKNIDKLMTTEKNKADLVVLPKSIYQKNSLILLRDSVLVRPDIAEPKSVMYYIGKWK